MTADRLTEEPALAAECGLGAKSQPAFLASWYSSHPQVRRLWAIDEVDSILIVMKIEPTVDGYDALPLWLANRAQWLEELASTFRRPVHLQMLGTPVCAEALSAMNDALIAEFSWREEYCG